MTMKQLISAFNKIDTDSMSRAAKTKYLKQVSARADLTGSQVVNTLRDKRNSLKRPPAALEVALYRARRCYHAGFGR